ncbi:MAG TPA: hypothetical protein VIP11_08725 [Gemmatimonadaceae bacterium]
MTDPREVNEQATGDEQPQADREEAQEVRAEESNDAQSARQSDPCEGGEISEQLG